MPRRRATLSAFSPSTPPASLLGRGRGGENLRKRRATARFCAHESARFFGVSCVSLLSSVSSSPCSPLLALALKCPPPCSLIPVSSLSPSFRQLLADASLRYLCPVEKCSLYVQATCESSLPALFARKVLALCANPPSIAVPRTASPAPVLLAARALCTALLLAPFLPTSFFLACTPAVSRRSVSMSVTYKSCAFPHPSIWLAMYACPQESTKVLAFSYFRPSSAAQAAVAATDHSERSPSPAESPHQRRL